MRKKRIVVGKAYVNEEARVLREVVEEVDDQRIKFNAFDLATGKLLPSRHRVCPAQDMETWSQREATPEEQAFIHPFESAAWPDPWGRPQRGIDPLEVARAAREAAPGPQVFQQFR